MNIEIRNKCNLKKSIVIESVRVTCTRGNINDVRRHHTPSRFTASPVCPIDPLSQTSLILHSDARLTVFAKDKFNTGQ